MFLDPRTGTSAQDTQPILHISKQKAMPALRSASIFYYPGFSALNFSTPAYKQQETEVLRHFYSISSILSNPPTPSLVLRMANDELFYT